MVGLALALALAKPAHAADTLIVPSAKGLTGPLTTYAANVSIEVRATPLAHFLSAYRADPGEEVKAVFFPYSHATASGILGTSAWPSAPGFRPGLFRGHLRNSLSRLTLFRRHGLPPFLAFSAARSPLLGEYRVAYALGLPYWASGAGWLVRIVANGA